jgi:hypothetical protein
MYHEERKLPVTITDEERQEYEKRNAAIDIDTIVAKEQLDAAKGIYKEKTEGIAKEKKNNLQILRQGYEMRLVKVAEYVNEDEALMEYFDEENVLVHSRALTLDERRQLRINFNNQRQLND